MSTSPSTAPSLSSLASGRRGWRRRVPLVQQMQETDCGAACLAMVLAYHGCHVALGQVREAIGVDRNGADAYAIVRAADAFGLHGRGLKIEPDDLAHLGPGAILHWGFNHFVVFEGVSRRGVHIVDPATGRRTVPMERFGRLFTGIGLAFEVTTRFRKAAPRPSQVWRYLRRFLDQRGALYRVVVMSVMLRVFALSLPILTGLVVDRVVPRGDRHLLAVVGGGLGILVLFQFLSTFIRAHLLVQLRTVLDMKMTLGFIGHMVTLPYRFFQGRPAGDLMMRVNSNATIREMLTTSTLSALLDGTLIAVYLIIIFALSRDIGALVLALGSGQIILYALSKRRYRELMAQGLETQARSQSYLVHLIAGIETLKAAGAEQRAVERWSNLFSDEINVSLERGRFAALIESLMYMLRTAAPLLILSVGALLVMDGSLSLGTMLALNALAISFLMPLDTLVESAIQMQLLGSYIERIDDVLGAEPEQAPNTRRAAPRLSGNIRVEGVTFRYGNGAAVVEDVSLRIRAGSCVAIVGESGSGKSTLARLLLGLYPPSSGHLCYDEHDLSGLDLRSVRQQLGIVMQQPYLFGNSIRSNIAMSHPGATMEQVIAAARAACIHDTIAAMPMGYETIIGDDGVALAGGERQRIALARALVHRPAILLLDEATSALDNRTEKRVMQNLERMKCTRIIIAHRLSTIAGADDIIVLDRGRVVEHGSHEELMARQGTYFRLVRAQP